MNWIWRGCGVVMAGMVGLVVLSILVEVFGGVIRRSRPQVPRVVARLTDRDGISVEVSVRNPWEIRWQAKEGDLRILASSFGWHEPTIEEIKPFTNLHPESVPVRTGGPSYRPMRGIVQTGDPHVIRIEHGGTYRLQVIPEYGDDEWSIEVVQIP